MWLARGIDSGCIKLFLNDLASVYILEDCILNFVLSSLHLEQFPPEVDLNSALVALIKSNFVGIGEAEDLFVWGKVCDFGICCCSSLKLILAHELLVVEGVEITAFSFVGVLGRISN